MRQVYIALAIVIGFLATTPIAHSDQLKTGIIKSAPSPTQIIDTQTPTHQVPSVKPAPGATTVPTKQGITAPLGQKATIAVKSPAQGTQHPAGKPLPIIWDRSTIATAATVNILLMDRPGGTIQTAIKTGAANTGNFMSWTPSPQFTVPGKSWIVRIETIDKMSHGHSGAFSFAKSDAGRTESGLPQQNNQNPSTNHITAQHTVQNNVSISKDVRIEKDDSSGINMNQIDIMQTQINILKRELEDEKAARADLEEKLEKYLDRFESHVHGMGRRTGYNYRSKLDWDQIPLDAMIPFVTQERIKRNQEDKTEDETSTPK
jgi:hypothetical protein